MANRRMFSLKIIDTDAFLDMSPTAQLLYFHLAMRADDDGFVASPKKIMKMANGADDDMRILIAKQYLIPFESGVCVIKDWKIHNYIQTDRYAETEYKEEKGKLIEKDGKYLLKHECIQDVYISDTQVRLELGKVRKGKDILQSNALLQEPFKEEPKEKPLTDIQQVVNYFFSLKGWDINGTGGEKVYSRYVRPAKDLLGLCEDSVSEAQACIKKVADWADSRQLDWGLETIFKKWYELDLLKPKEKKPYYEGNRMFEMGGKMFVLMPNGEKMEFAGKESDIKYK